MRLALRMSLGGLVAAALLISALLGAQAAFAAPTIPNFAPHLVTNIPVGTTPFGVAVNPETNRIYVADGGGGGGPDNTVFVISGKSNTLLTKITGLTAPDGVAVNGQTNRIYVTNIGNNTVSVIDGRTNTVTTPAIPVGADPAEIAVNERTNRIYVTNSFDNTLPGPPRSADESRRVRHSGSLVAWSAHRGKRLLRFG
jgi:YVTN family beta-propeller protein